MKLYKWKKSDVIETVVGLIFAIIFAAIALYFDWPSPDEILFDYLLPCSIIGIPLLYLILCILTEMF